MTQSITKARNNWVCVTVEGKEHWIDPLELKLGDKTLFETLNDLEQGFTKEYAKLKDEFDTLIKGMSEKYEADLNVAHGNINALRQALETLVGELSRR